MYYVCYYTSICNHKGKVCNTVHFDFTHDLIISSYC